MVKHHPQKRVPQPWTTNPATPCSPHINALHASKSGTNNLQSSFGHLGKTKFSEMLSQMLSAMCIRTKNSKALTLTNLLIFQIFWRLIFWNILGILCSLLHTFLAFLLHTYNLTFRKTAHVSLIKLLIQILGADTHVECISKVL